MGRTRTEINSEPMKRNMTKNIDCDKILKSVFVSQKSHLRNK